MVGIRYSFIFIRYTSHINLKRPSSEETVQFDTLRVIAGLSSLSWTESAVFSHSTSSSFWHRSTLSSNSYPSGQRYNSAGSKLPFDSLHNQNFAQLLSWPNNPSSVHS